MAERSILEYLPQVELQEALGSDLLERLETFAPALLDAESDGLSVYRRATLVRILESFGTPKLLADRKLLRRLYESIPDDRFWDIAEKSGFAEKGQSRSEVQEALVGHGWKSGPTCRAIAVAGQLPERLVPASAERRSDRFVVSSSRAPFKQLIDYQFYAMQEAVEALKNPRARLVLQMPTGSGKTRTAMEIVSQVLNQAGSRRVVWLAHSSELCDQAVQCFDDVWVHLGRDDAAVRCYYDGMRPVGQLDEKELVVASFQTLYSDLDNKKGFFAESRDVDLVVVDEAHRVIAPTYRAVTEGLVSDNTQVLGLTATPGRGLFDFEGNEELARFFFSRVVQLRGHGDESAIEHLQKRGVLSTVEQERLQTTSSIELTPQDRRYIAERFDLPPRVLNELGQDDVRTFEIVGRLRDLAKDGASIIFFATSVEHSRFVCALLHLCKISSVHVDGGVGTDARRKAIDGFKSGVYQVMCNFGVLATGFDAPNTDVVFIARPTASVVLYSQMIGRGLRGPRVGGTESCRVVNVVDNIIGMPENNEIFDVFADYWS